MSKHIKELTTSDVVGALIRQQSAEDYLPALKAYLFQTHPQLQQEDYEAEQHILLPEFATQQYNQEQLLALHFRRNNYQPHNLVNYESLLSSVDNKMHKIINSYGSSFENSNLIIEELITQLGHTSTYLTRQRQPLKSLSLHLRDKYLAICRKQRAIKNMQKTLDVMRFWNSSNISQVLRIKPTSIVEYPELESLFKMFEDIVEGLHQRKDEFANYGNLVALVVDRKKAIIEQLQQNANNCILYYQSQQKLMTILAQYEYVLQHNLIPNKQLLFSSKQLPHLIQSNINSLYQQALHRSNSLDLPQEAAFIAFYKELFSLWTQYFNSWHQVTTYHVQQQTLYKENFIQLRTTVFQKMLEKVEQSLKYNSRVDGLSLGKMMVLFKFIDDFMTVGEQWMGKCKSHLPELLAQKYNLQISQYFKIKNGQLKRVLFDQLGVSAYQKEQYKYLSDSELLQAKLTIREELLHMIAEKETHPKEGHSNRFVKSKTQQKFNFQPLSKDQAVEDMNSYLERLNSHLGLTLYKMMVEYQLRQQEVPSSNQIYQLQHHFEYVIVLIYKMCIPTYMKKEIEQEIFDQAKRHIKQSTVKTALLRHTIDQDTLTAINELRHLFLDRNTFGELHDFIKHSQPKYQGITLNSYLNVNLYYQEYQKYEPEINTLSETFLNLMHELYMLNQYLHKISSRYSSEVAPSLPNFSNVIASLVLFYFTTYFECYLQRFYSQVVPLFLNVKFEVKKLHEFKGSLREYKQRIAELFNRLNVEKFSRQTCFNGLLVAKQTEYLYKFVIDLFSRIQKVNDNGREILKQEVSQLAKIVRVEGNQSPEEWHSWLMMYLDLSKERSEKVLLDKAQKMVIRFPVQWWRSSLLWFWGDCSSKERKQFSHKLVTVYLNRLLSLPHI